MSSADVPSPCAVTDASPTQNEFDWNDVLTQAHGNTLDMFATPLGQSQSLSTKAEIYRTRCQQWDAISDSPNHYQTTDDLELFESHGATILKGMKGKLLVELGSANMKKSRALFRMASPDNLPRLYMAVDVRECTPQDVRQFASDHPEVRTVGVVTDTSIILPHMGQLDEQKVYWCWGNGPTFNNKPEINVQNLKNLCLKEDDKLWVTVDAHNLDNMERMVLMYDTEPWGDFIGGKPQSRITTGELGETIHEFTNNEVVFTSHKWLPSHIDQMCQEAGLRIDFHESFNATHLYGIRSQ